MADNEFAGSALYATWVHSGGTIVISTEFRNWNFLDSGESEDATAYADAYKSTWDNYETCGVSASWLMQNDMGTADVTGLRKGIEGTLTWGEAGTASTKIKRTMLAKIDSSNWSTPYNDIVSIDANWVQNGALTISAY